MKFYDALEQCNKDRLVENAIKHYKPEPYMVKQFDRAYRTLLYKLLKIVPEFADGERFNGAFIVQEEYQFTYEVESCGPRKEIYLASEYFDFDDKTNVGLDFTPFRAWLNIDIWPASLELYPLETIVSLILQDMLFYTNIYSALLNAPLEEGTQRAYNETKNRYEKFTAASEKAHTPGDGVDMNELLHEVIRVMHEDIPNDLISDIRIFISFLSLYESYINTESMHRVVGGHFDAMHKPVVTEDVQRAYDRCESYRRSTGKKTTITLENFLKTKLD